MHFITGMYSPPYTPCKPTKAGKVAVIIHSYRTASLSAVAARRVRGPISKQQKQASKTRQPSALPLFGMNVNKPGRGRPPANAQWDPQPGQPSGCWRHTVTGEPIHSHERARFQNSMHRHPQMGAKKVRSQCGRVEPRNVLRDCVRRSPSHSPQPLPRFTVTTYKIADDGIV